MSLRTDFVSNILYPFADILNRTSIMEKYKFLKKSQWWSKKELEDFQFMKFRRLINHIYANVPFYRRYFKSEKLLPSDFKSLSDIKKLPVLTREDVKKHNEELRSYDIKGKGVISAQTGGTTGQPLSFIRDKETRSWAWGAMYRFFEWTGTYVGEKRITVGGGSLGGYLMKTNTWSILAKGVDKLQGNYFFPAFSLDKEIITNISRYVKNRKIRIMRGYPSTLYIIAQTAEKYHLDFSNIEICWTTAEKLFPHQREFVEQVFSADMYDQYGFAEIHSVAAQCKKKNLYHIFDEHVFAETNHEEDTDEFLLNATLTDLDNYVMPFIRYDPGDVLRIGRKNCSCGRNLTTLEGIEGRIHDFLVASDGRVIPGEFIPHLFQRVQGFDRYFVHQISEHELIVKIVKNSKYNEMEVVGLKRVLHQHLGEDVSIHFDSVTENELPKTRSGKIFFVRSNVTPDFD